MGFTVVSRRSKAIPIRLGMAYDKEEEIKLPELWTKACFVLLKKKKNLKFQKKKRIYMGSGVTKKKKCGPSAGWVGQAGAWTNQYSKASWARYLVDNPRHSSRTFFYVKGDNETSPSNLQVVLKVKSEHINEMCYVVQGSTQMSSYFRYEALYEKCGYPGSPSKVRRIKAAKHCG